jgi:Icc protein
MKDEKILKIAHITDLHISPDEKLRFGVNTRETFKRVLAAIVSEKPDFIAVSGDLAWMRAEKKAYFWLKAQLDNTTIPYYITSGNHDKASRMAKIFNREHYLSNGRFDYILHKKGRIILFLDCGSGKIKKKQLQWLRETAQYLKGDVMVFMHYPPAPGGSVYMDKNYPLRNSREFLEIMKGLSSVKYLVCGHYHTENQYTIAGKEVYVTPSTCVQIDPKTEDLVFSKQGPAYRIIEWSSEEMKTEVKYIL